MKDIRQFGVGKIEHTHELRSITLNMQFELTEHHLITQKRPPTIKTIKYLGKKSIQLPQLEERCTKWQMEGIEPP